LTPRRELIRRPRATPDGHGPRNISRLAINVQGHFRVEVHNDHRAAVVRVSGELDLASSPALEEELEQVGSSDATLVIVDLRELEFMDSTGLSVLIKAQQRAEDIGQRFAVVRGPQQVQRLLSLTGVADKLTLADTPEELLSSG
jgi:anti-sigma B factor antagonist